MSPRSTTSLQSSTANSSSTLWDLVAGTNRHVARTNDNFVRASVRECVSRRFTRALAHESFSPCSRNRVATGNHVTPQVCQTFFRHRECLPVRNYTKFPAVKRPPASCKSLSPSSCRNTLRDVFRLHNEASRFVSISNKEIR